MYVPVLSFRREPTISVPTHNTDPLNPLLPQQRDAEGLVSTPGSRRYLSLLSVRPVAPLSFPPPSRARSRLRISPQGGRRQRDDLLPGRRVGKGGSPLPEGRPRAALPGPHPARGRWPAARRSPGRLEFEKCRLLAVPHGAMAAGTPEVSAALRARRGDSWRVAGGEEAFPSWAAASIFPGCPLPFGGLLHLPCAAGSPPAPGGEGGSGGGGSGLPAVSSAGRGGRAPGRRERPCGAGGIR